MDPHAVMILTFKRNLCADPERKCVLFSNEHSIETFVERQDGKEDRDFRGLLFFSY